MKRISVKNIQRQISQASDFYGKSDISPEDFFRYAGTPFLAKKLIGIPCSQQLFLKITTDIHAENHLSDDINVDVEDSIKIVDNKRKTFLNTARVVLVLLCLMLITLVSYNISDVKSASSVLGNFVVVTLGGGFIIFFIVNPMAEGIANLYTARMVKYKNLIIYLGAQFFIYKNNLEYWNNLSWQNFEFEVTKRLNQFGYNAVNTKLSGDEGVDIVINNQNEKFILQCKAMKNKIGPAFVRDFVGTIGIQGATGGMIVSLSGFSDGALEAANYSNLHLLSIKEFILLEKAQLKLIIGW